MFLFVAATILLTWLVFMPIHFRSKSPERRAAQHVSKVLPTMLAAGFAAYGCFAAHNSSDYALLIFAGLCVCTLADLMIGIRFEVGGALFFCGHLLYIAALGLYGLLSWWSLAVFAAAFVLMHLFLSHYRKQVPGKLISLGLSVYAAALAALLGFSLPLPFAACTQATVLAALGSALFVVSDLTLCHNMLRDKPPAWQYVSLGIYYTAQLLLGLSTLPAL
ncbi:MAG: lysoplasmalogenase family protein [Clostridia bacterium]